MSSVAEPLELPTYEEVTRYQHQPGERPRLVVLIGRWRFQEVGWFAPWWGGEGAQQGPFSLPFVSQGPWEPGYMS